MAFRFTMHAPTIALIVAACSGSAGNSHDTALTHTEIETAGGSAGSEPATPNSEEMGGRPNTKPHLATAGGGSAATAGGSAGADAPDAQVENAGMGGAAGEAGQPPPPCDLAGNCSTGGDGAKVTCDIQGWNECEFSGFVGATAQVGWGERVAIGTACCGACGCVPVEVYFDGERCWQGIPQCTGQWVHPHPTTTPNPSFSPRTDVYGTFHLGSGGYGGSAETTGSGGSDASAGGTALNQGEAGTLVTTRGGGSG